MMNKLARLLVPVVFVLVILIVVFMFLGLEMSSSYTRSNPDCDVWCNIFSKISDLLS